MLCFDHTRIKKPTIKIKDKIYSLIMLSLAKSETSDSSGYFQMSLANWGNPTNGHLKDSRSGVLLLGKYSKKWLSGVNEELCQEHSALLPLKREEGGNTVKKNMSFSKWARGGGEGNNVAFSCWFIRFLFPWSTSALGRNSLTFNTVALYDVAFLWSKK